MRKRYRITKKDAPITWRWVLNRTRETRNFPHQRAKLSLKAVEEFKIIEQEEHEELNEWCEEHLSSSQWLTLKQTIRTHRLNEKREIHPELQVKRLALPKATYESLQYFMWANELNNLTTTIEYLLNQHQLE